MSQPFTLSVLMSIYKKEHPEYLKSCLESLEGQTVQPDEYVIIADGPLTPALDQELADFEARATFPVNIYRFEENRGLGLALQDGVKFAKSTWIARMDTDDIARRDRFEQQIAYLRSHPDVELIGSNVMEFENDPMTSTTEKQVPETNEEIRQYVRRRNPFNHMSVMYKKESVLAAGNYQPLSGYEDYYLWARMLKQGTIAYNIQEPLVYARGGSEMYQRRGGMAYLRHGIQAYNKIYGLGLASPMDWVIRTGAQVVVNLMPNSLRGRFYQRALRKEK
ncbi:MAG: glycosyltransferase [Aerococcus sp.]|nr:glycosyltransferase [Aerococcus sp.]